MSFPRHAGSPSLGLERAHPCARTVSGRTCGGHGSDTVGYGGADVSLIAPAFLFGLLAIGLPLWLHRLSSDNPNKQKFSSSMFLEPGEPRRVLAKKLQYLLLLALRLAVLVLLALAFAQPALWRKPQAAAS